MENNQVCQEQKNSVKLIKGVKGFRWEIKIYENDLDVLLRLLREMNQKLGKDYGVQQ